jgi:arsenite methyltransferase
MAVTCPLDLDTRMLRSEVSKVYSRVAAEPDADFHFHRGPAYAAEFLGYDSEELAALPATCTASFAGIANPHAIGPLAEGETVLDIGCGAGTDLLLAARRIGPSGRAIGIDMTDAMRNRTLSSAAAAGLANVEVHLADATSLPLPDASVDHRPLCQASRRARLLRDGLFQAACFRNCRTDCVKSAGPDSWRYHC